MTGPRGDPVDPAIADAAGGRHILVVDVGGSHVKCLLAGEAADRRFDSGPDMGPGPMVARVLDITGDWSYDRVSIGFPGPVRRGRPSREPHNLGPGWVAFDYEAAFERPVRMINDAAMQALGGYHGGSMLFLGFGTGLGSALIVDGALQPLELAHLPWREGGTYEDWLGDAALERDGVETWRRRVAEVFTLFRDTLLPDYIVAGGGNIRLIGELPAWVERGANDNAFRGGFLLWEGDTAPGDDATPRSHP